MIKTKILLILFAISLFSQTYDEFLKEQNQDFGDYEKNTNKEFEAYKNAHDIAIKEYAKSIGQKWPAKDISTKHKWIEYSKDYNQKKSIDFQKEEISIEVIAKNEREAQAQIEKAFNDLYNYDTSKAFENDVIEAKIAKKLKIPKRTLNSKQKLISDIINKKQKNKILKRLKKQRLKKVKYKGRYIYKANIKFPSNSMLQKAKSYSENINHQSNKTKMPKELIYAIMHSESNFNPMARSHIPAFGLMQIVPRSAGVDTYNFLYGKKKLLSSRYLYQSNNNILIGSNYLHIVYFKYLRKIKNKKSRLYCTIAAYNTGAGNVAKAFIGTSNIHGAAKIINTMSSEDVYKRLIKKLPYDETKKYLYKVRKRMNTYGVLIQNGKLN